jgi:hypothetical protein
MKSELATSKTISISPINQSINLTFQRFVNRFFFGGFLSAVNMSSFFKVFVANAFISPF